MQVRHCIGLVLIVLAMGCGDELFYAQAQTDALPRNTENPGAQDVGEVTSCLEQWTQRYMTFETQRAFVVKPWGDGFMLGGSADAQDRDFADTWSLRINGQGQITGEYQQDGPNFENIYTILPSSNGGSIAFGYASYNAYTQDIHIWRADAEHKLIADHHFDGPGSETILHVSVHPEGGYLALVASKMGEQGWRQGALWFLRLGEDGSLLQEHLTPPDRSAAYFSAHRTDRDTLLVSHLITPVGQNGFVVRERSFDGADIRSWSYPSGTLRQTVMVGKKLLILIENSDGSLRLIALDDTLTQIDTERTFPDLAVWSVYLAPLPSGQGVAMLAQLSDEVGGGIRLETFDNQGNTQTVYTVPDTESAPTSLNVTADGTAWFTTQFQTSTATTSKSQLNLNVVDLESGELQMQEELVTDSNIEMVWRGGLMELDHDSVLVTFQHSGNNNSQVVVARRSARCINP